MMERSNRHCASGAHIYPRGDSASGNLLPLIGPTQAGVMTSMPGVVISSPGVMTSSSPSLVPHYPPITSYTGLHLHGKVLSVLAHVFP